jgi:hypothetical protein
LGNLVCFQGSQKEDLNKARLIWWLAKQIDLDLDSKMGDGEPRLWKNLAVLPYLMM